MEYETKDIVLAAYLKVSGCTLIDIKMCDRKGTFIFDNVSQTMVTQYCIGNSLVEPVAFNNIVRQLTTACRRLQ